MGVLTLSAFAKPEDVTKKGGGCLKAGAKIRITARGTDAVAAVRAIEKEFCNPELDFDRKAEPFEEGLARVFATGLFGKIAFAVGLVLMLAVLIVGKCSHQ